MEKMSERDKLYYLIKAFLKKEYSVEDFCNQFETIYNLELDASTVSEKELEVFKKLFEKTAYYSPYPEDRKKWPGFTKEEDIEKAVQKASKALNISI